MRRQWRFWYFGHNSTSVGQSLYAHLREVRTSVGDRVRAGTVIGLSGSSGMVTGPHLHFAIIPNKADLNNGYLGFIDPSPYFSD
ncbi:M23 family metallopeptidase [Candidatus Gottesmanbacteria bacterium]|nr:M23 family metallopeptidase [Candidatus Gottesmanbacteria bacterium]